jgi:hypothetical protein
VALVLLAALFALGLARPAAPPPSALLALSGLVFLWLWSLLSSTSAESANSAFVEANRWLLYAALFTVLVLLLRDDRVRKVLLGAATTAILALAAYITAVCMFGDGPSLFLAARLNDPLGYINGEAGYLLLAVWPLIALAEQARRALIAGAALGLATLVAGLAMLSHSRATCRPSWLPPSC